jgi:hypothetical protein
MNYTIQLKMYNFLTLDFLTYTHQPKHWFWTLETALNRKVFQISLLQPFRIRREVF